MPKLITILGPTASGKTSLAVQLAAELGGEVLSADSRQVYRGMDIGTGKDLSEYTYQGKPVPYHLIDLVDAGQRYNLFQYQQDFGQAYTQVLHRGALPLLCGGSGLYLEAVTRNYQLVDVPQNPELRQRLEQRSLQELADQLRSYGPLHNTTDIDNKKRVIRAIEIAEYTQQAGAVVPDKPTVEAVFFGVELDRDTRRSRITQRLHQRLQQGMVAEVEGLLQRGIAPDDLIYYGLEYKYITEYLIGRYGYEQMVDRLNTAIHQFAKRQMTWFRGMSQRRGVEVFWGSHTAIRDRVWQLHAQGALR